MLIKPGLIYKLFFLTLLISCNKDNNISELDYRTKWYGEYEGEAHYYRTYPSVDSPGVWVTDRDTNLVIIYVSPAEVDSCLDIKVDYETWPDQILDQMKFSGDGTYEKSTGTGSSYTTMIFKFSGDSVYFGDARKCGIPCNSRISCNLARK